jgi:hypothetical protein
MPFRALVAHHLPSTDGARRRGEQRHHHQPRPGTARASAIRLGHGSRAPVPATRVRISGSTQATRKNSTAPVVVTYDGGIL